MDLSDHRSRVALVVRLTIKTVLIFLEELIRRLIHGSELFAALI
jgi:hypothetical protein